MEYTLVGGLPLRGRLRVPGDKSISHRALILGAIAEGVSEVAGLSNGDDVRRTAAAMSALGAKVNIEFADRRADGHGGPSGHGSHGGHGTVEGGHLREPDSVIDLGNSGTSMRLVAGLCAGLDGLSVLTGDRSLSSRPMDRVAVPLRQMGARLDGREGGRLPPLVIRGGQLRGIQYDMTVASAQVKSAILLAGLSAEGDTVIHEATPTRAHTEEMLAASGATIEVVEGTSPGTLVVRLSPSDIKPHRWEVPGDPSQAAYWLVAACIVPGSEIVVDNVYLGLARSGFVDVLARMGADVERLDERTVRAAYSPDLHGTDVTAGEIPGLVDEIPVLAVAAAVAHGTTTFRGAGELRVKETDRIATIASELRRLGASIETATDGLSVIGGTALMGARVASHGDHRVAMAMAVAAMVATGTTTVEGWEAVGTSYPEFERDLEWCRR